MRIKVSKYTDVAMLRRANAASTGTDSNMTLATAYRLGHTPVRTQKFEITMTDIPQFVASQLVRQRQGVEWVMKSKRTDRGGSDFGVHCFEIARNLKASALTDTLIEDDFDDILNLPKYYDRYAPTDLWCDINAEALMNMAHKRLCCKASAETQRLVENIRNLVEETDPDLARHMVPQCVFRGGICPELRCCGYIHSEDGQQKLNRYRALFTSKQIEI